MIVLCSHLAVSLQVCKLVFAITALCTPSGRKFPHCLIRHSGLPCTAFYVGNVILLFRYGLQTIAYLSILMSYASVSLWMHQKCKYGWTEAQGMTTDWVAEDTRKGQLRTVVYSSDLERFGTMCSICLEGLERGVEVKQLWCNHLFHVACVDRWYSVHRSCPMRCERSGEDLWRPSRSDSPPNRISHAQAAREDEQHERQDLQLTCDSDSDDERQSNPSFVSV